MAPVATTYRPPFDAAGLPQVPVCGPDWQPWSDEIRCSGCHWGSISHTGTPVERSRHEYSGRTTRRTTKVRFRQQLSFKHPVWLAAPSLEFTFNLDSAVDRFTSLATPHGH
jgi:hypothetical protein